MNVYEVGNGEELTCNYPHLYVRVPRGLEPTDHAFHFLVTCVGNSHSPETNHSLTSQLIMISDRHSSFRIAVCWEDSFDRDPFQFQVWRLTAWPNDTICWHWPYEWCVANPNDKRPTSACLVGAPICQRREPCWERLWANKVISISRLDHERVHGYKLYVLIDI